MKPEHQLLHQKFQQYGSNAREWMRKCVLLLPEIERCRIWEQKRFGSIYEYAAKLAGMSRNTVDDALRILKKIEDKPQLQKVVAIKGINAVRPIAAIATAETQSFWAEKALQMSKHTLEVYVQEVVRGHILEEDGGFLENNIHVLKDGREEISRTGTGNNAKNRQKQANLFLESALPDAVLEGGTDAGESPTRTSSVTASNSFAPSKKIVAMELKPEVLEQLEKLKGQGNWNDLMEQLLQIRTQRLEQQQPEAVAATSRHIPSKIQRHVLRRTNGTCAFPACKKPMTIQHHTQRFALEKVHDPARLYGLCTQHERIAHLGLIENEEQPADTWRVQKEPDRTAAKFKVDALVAKYRGG